MTLVLGEIVIDCADHEAVVPFWMAAMGDYVRHDVNEQYVAIAPRRAGRRPAADPVPEGAGAQDRQEPRPPRPARRLAWPPRWSGSRRLGATVIAERTLGETMRWTVMADPEGNEFCISGG